MLTRINFIMYDFDQMLTAHYRWVSGIDMQNRDALQMSTLDPGMHNISVRTLNTDGECPGQLSFVTYETFEVLVEISHQQSCFYCD